MTKDFRDLVVWNKAMELTEVVYELTARFPADERSGLTSQVRRAVVSVSSCIAEGNARNSTRDYLRFLSMASGSLAEVQTQLLLGMRLRYVTKDDAGVVLEKLKEVTKMLQALKNSLNGKLSLISDSPFPVPRSPT